MSKLFHKSKVHYSKCLKNPRNVKAQTVPTIKKKKKTLPNQKLPKLLLKSPMPLQQK